MTCSNSAGSLGNGRKKLGLVPLAQWNHKSDALLQWEKHGNCNFFNILAEAAQSKGKLENCRENKPYAICLYVVTCSNSAGNLGNGRKKLGLVPLAQWNHKNEAFLQWEKHRNCNFFSSCPRWSAPTQSKNKKMAKKPIQRMETTTFSAVWQKPSKAKENLEHCRENKPCAICFY